MQEFKLNDGPGIVRMLARVGSSDLGAILEPASEVLRSQLDLPEKGGLIVREVFPESRAAGAELKKNDILLEVDGKPATDPAAVDKALSDAAEKAVKGLVLRKGDKVEVEFKPAEKPKPSYYLGISVSEIDGAAREQLKLEEGQGIAVGDVVEDSPAAKSGLKEGDILVEFAEKPVKDGESLVGLVQDNGAREVKLQILRDGEKKTITVTPTERPVQVVEGYQFVPGQQQDRVFRFFGPGAVVEPGAPQAGPGPGVNRRFGMRRGPGGMPLDLPPGVPGEVRTFNFPGPERIESLEKKLEDLTRKLEKLQKSLEDSPKPKDGKKDKQDDEDEDPSA
jgi:membrane-associated protease RseP (regulator of RpoE activity)